MAALRCAMSKLAGGRALLRLRASLPVSASRSMSSAGASSMPPKHPPSAAAGQATHQGDHVTRPGGFISTMVNIGLAVMGLGLAMGVVQSPIRYVPRQVRVQDAASGGEVQSPIRYVPRQVMVQDAVSGGEAPKKTDLADNP